MVKNYEATAEHYRKKFNLKVSANSQREGIDDEVDAFRHAYAAASSTVKANGAISDILGNIIEGLDPFMSDENVIRQRKQTNMDLWNNSIGREIGEELRNELCYKKYDESKLDDIIAEKVYKRIKKGLKDCLDDYKDGMGKINKNKKPVLTGATLKEMKVAQRERLQDFAERIFSTKVEAKEFDSKFSRDYVNEVSGDSKIFTKEDLESMSEDELGSKKKAIDFQKEKMGIPTKKEAEKEVLKGGMIHVKSYVRSDGTKVRNYYRAI